MKVVMSRGFNFGAGPATLPESLLLAVQDELLEWQGTKGMSILEIGHRTSEFMHLLTQAEQLLRKLLAIPADYHVLFLGAPARSLFGMIPMNFLNNQQRAGYLVTGLWSEMAYQEAQKIKQEQAAYCIASNRTLGFNDIPAQNEWQFKPETAYVYYTPNETVNGVYLATPPIKEGISLIADMTSCLLTEPLNINNFDLIFAGAQKNIANAGMTIVIIRDSLLNKINDHRLPTMYDFRTHVKHQSLYATPPVFNCYLAYKMFQWLEQQGGITKVHEVNQAKANKLYHYIDTSHFYHCPVVKSARSMINICFSLSNPALEEIFVKQAEKQQLYALKGHRLVGGLRASLYNAMPTEGVDALIKFMEQFAQAQQ